MDLIDQLYRFLLRALAVQRYVAEIATFIGGEVHDSPGKQENKYV